jgi:lipopolysaccharide transport system ATP-binding protein
VLNHERLDKDWEMVNAEMQIPIVEEERFQHTLQKIVDEERPDVEIADVTVLANGEETDVIKERQPFELRVRIFANRLTPRTDVLITIYRSDGVYVFWQSSGMNEVEPYDTSRNLRDISGSVSVHFIFNHNYFNAGEYHIHAYCANGWDMLNNLPQSEVFDVKINAYKFTVLPEFNIQNMDFGQINMRVPVVYHKNDYVLLREKLRDSHGEN